VDVTWSEEESSALQKALSSYLSDLRMEITDTDNPSYRRELRHERELLEGAVTKLDEARASSDARDEQGRVVVRLVTVWAT